MNKMNLTYGSVCSGIEAATVAWHTLGFQPVWFAEIEKYPSSLLEHYYRNVPNLGDMCQIKHYIDLDEYEAPDILVGGTPCQAFSVAGTRGSLDDARGQLTLEYVKLLDKIDEKRQKNGIEPCIAVWENVPGVLSTKDNAFGCFIAALAGCQDEVKPEHIGTKKWGKVGFLFGSKRTVAWRILDAQYFGLAQRRKRVFVVASARENTNPAQILFEFDRLCRDTPPCRNSRQEATSFTSSSFGQYSEGVGTIRANGGDLGGGSETLCVATGQANAEILEGLSPTLNCAHEQPIVTYGLPGNWIGGSPNNGGNAVEPMIDIAPCQTKTDVHAVAFASKQQSMNCQFDVSNPLLANDYKEPQAVAFYENHPADSRVTEMGDVCTTVTSRWGTGGGNVPYAQMQMQVRRLTPTECERLQGFPDGYTNIPNSSDSKRYKALGNSMAVTVMHWLGKRIVAAINNPWCDEI